MEDVELIELTGWTFDELDSQPAWRVDRLAIFAAARRQAIADRADAPKATTTTDAQGRTVVRTPVQR